MGLGEGLGLTSKIMNFSLADKKKTLFAVKFCSIIEDGVYSVIATFEEILLSNLFLIHFNFKIIVLVFSSFYKVCFYQSKKNRSQKPFVLEQKQRQFWLDSLKRS